jgi:hypothetical protein
MARSAGPNELQTSLRLSRELYSDLDAAREGRPLGEEIRRRLEASLSGAPTAADPMTNELLLQIAELSKIVERAFGNWHTDPGAHAVFIRAINKTLSGYQPAGDPVLILKDGAPSALRGVADIETAAVAASLAALAATF